MKNAWMASSPGHQFWLFLVEVVQERFKQSIQLKEERDKKRKDEERYPENKNDDENKNVEGDKVDTDMGAEVATGPVVLKEAYDTWQCMLSEERARMRTMPAGYVFVSDWHGEDGRIFFNSVCNDTNIKIPEVQRKCQRAYPNAHVITFWSHSWEVPWWENEEDAAKRTRQG